MPENKPRIYLSSPHMGGEELDYIHEAFETNWIAPLGANVNGFEQDLQDYTGRKHAAVVTSGTAALHLALILCDVKPGDEVICQSFTFAASANPIRYQGATPVFIDSEPETWNMDPDLLKKPLKNGLVPHRMNSLHPMSQPFSVRQVLKELTTSTASEQKNTSAIHPIKGIDRMKPGLPKAIIVVHLYGMPAKMDRILEIGKNMESR
jgi:dTDP-4-amino-4,6-dideoxygalactose transaminase